MAATVHVKRRLTNISIHFPHEFTSIGDEFFPSQPSEHLTDQFAVWNKANLLAMGEFSPLGDDDQPQDLELKQDADISYSCKVFGIQSPGKWITERNADPSLDYETERTIQLTTSLRLRLEYLRVNQRLRNTALMQSSTLPAAQRFDSYTSATSRPISAMRNIVNQLGYANQGRKPNKIAMSTYTLIAIVQSEEYKDLTKYTSIQAMDDGDNAALRAQVESLIGVKKGTIKIADAVYNAAALGQTPVYTTFIGPDIVFGYVEALGIRKFSLSAGFQWSGYSNDPQAIIAVPRYQGTMLPVEDLRAFTVIDPKIIVPELGYLLKGAINGTDTASYQNLVAF
jgi:hypothetical protein